MNNSMPVTHAGAIVLRNSAIEREYLLVRARTEHNMWVFPKGHVEKAESFEEAALREVLEEGGVRAVIVGFLGEVTFGLSRTAMFLMEYDSPGNMPAERECVWLRLDSALAALHFPESKVLLRSAEHILNVRR